MVATLKTKKDGYYCSNCMMRQFGVPTHCYFCESEFTNWEEIAYKAVMTDVEEEQRKYESNLLGRDTTQNSI